MKGPVLSLSCPYRRGRAFACVIGPSLQKGKVWAVHRFFIRNLSLTSVSGCFVFFLAWFWDLFKRAPEQGLQLLYFKCWGRLCRRKEWLATRGWFRFLFSKLISVRYILLVPRRLRRVLTSSRGAGWTTHAENHSVFVVLRLRYAFECQVNFV